MIRSFIITMFVISSGILIWNIQTPSRACAANGEDGSLANPANRIAKSLDEISNTLKSIDRKLK